MREQLGFAVEFSLMQFSPKCACILICRSVYVFHLFHFFFITSHQHHVAAYPIPIGA